jgi:hypothetical protein
MILKIRDKEYDIKYGYRPTLKSNLLSELFKQATHSDNEQTDFSTVEEMLLYVPKELLVGLQVNHKDEFGYNYDTNEGYEEKLAKAEELVSIFCDEQDGDIIDLKNQLETEMMSNGFLKSLFEKMQEQAKKASKQK